MDLADRKLILVAVPDADGATFIVADHEWGGIRQRIRTFRVDRLSDDPLTVELPVDHLEAPPAAFAGPIAAALAVEVTSTVVVVLSTVASIVVNTVIGLGLSLLQNKLFGEKDRGGPPSLIPIRQVVRQATPRQRFIYGRALVGGAYCFLNKSPPYLVAQFLVAAHRCDAVEAVYINGYRCEFNAAGEAVTPRFRRDGTPFVEISTRLGDPDQAIDPLLAAEFPDVPTTFRQRGQTVVTLKAYYGADYEENEAVFGAASQFQPLFLVRGKPVHDPRLYSSDQDDETTWTWSRNWALCVSDWMRSSYGGRKRADQIDWDHVSAEADICDQPIGLTTGLSEPQFTLDGGFTSEENPFQIAEQMMASAGRAAALWRRGKFAPLCDVYREPVRTLTQTDLVGGFSYTSAHGRRDVLNTVRSEFVSELRDYKAAMSPPLIDSALVTSDGETLEATIQRPFVVGHERAQRLDELTLRRSRLGRQVTISIGIEHLELEVGDVINLEFEDFPQVDGTYTIRYARSGGLLRTMELTLEETPEASVHEWDPDTQVQDSSLVEIINPEAV